MLNDWAGKLPTTRPTEVSCHCHSELKFLLVILLTRERERVWSLIKKLVTKISTDVLALFRLSATVSRIGLMESRHCRGGPLAGYPPPRDGWLGRSAFALTKRTCFVFSFFRNVRLCHSAGPGHADGHVETDADQDISSFANERTVRTVKWITLSEFRLEVPMRFLSRPLAPVKQSGQKKESQVLSFAQLDPCNVILIYIFILWILL